MEFKQIVVFACSLDFIRSALSAACYIGRGYDELFGSPQWILPEYHPCQCAALRLAGELRVPLTPGSFHRMEEPFLSENADEVRTFFNCTAAPCAELPGKWQPFGHHCYLLVTEATDYGSAETSCQVFSKPGGSAHLASVLNPSESAFLREYLEAEPGTSDVWIGYDRLDSSGFAWTDGSERGTENWNVLEPSGGEKRCTVLEYSTQKWSASLCAQTYPFICKMPA